MRSEITTVGELVAALTALSAGDPGAAGRRTRLSAGRHRSAPSPAAPTTPTTDGRAPDPDEERVVWIGEGTQLGYLPEIARSALGHGWT